MTAAELYAIALGGLLAACLLWAWCFVPRWQAARHNADALQYKFYVEAIAVALVAGLGVIAGGAGQPGVPAAAGGVVLMRWLLGWVKPLVWRFIWQLLMSLCGWALLLLLVFRYF